MGLVGHSQETLFYIRPKGWLRIDELQRKEVQSSQAFVAMWFNPATDEPYENGLFKAIYDSGYDPRRVDQNTTTSIKLTTKSSPKSAVRVFW